MENTSTLEKQAQPDAAWKSEAKPETTDETTNHAEPDSNGVSLRTLSLNREREVSESLAPTTESEKLVDLVDDDLKIIEKAKASTTGSIPTVDSDSVFALVEDPSVKEIESPSIIEKVLMKDKLDTTPVIDDSTAPTRENEEFAPLPEAIEEFKAPLLVQKVVSDVIESAKKVATLTEKMESNTTVEVPNEKAVELEVDADPPKNTNKLDETFSVVGKDPVSENASLIPSQHEIKPEPINLLQSQTRSKIAGADHSLKTPKKSPAKSITQSPMVASPLKSVSGPAVRSAKRVSSIRTSLPATQMTSARSVSHRVSLPLASYGDGNDPGYMRPTIASLSKKVGRLELEHSNNNNNNN